MVLHLLHSRSCPRLETDRSVTPETTPPPLPEADAAKSDNARPAGGKGAHSGWFDLERIGPVAAFAGLLCYILGLLIVNAYLY